MGGRYRAGSITKTFVATVALQLVGEGRLRLTDTVERWLPGVVPQGNAITVRDLLQHSSGLYDYILAGMIIEAVTGRSYGDEITRRILRPLRLHDTGLPGTRQVIHRAHAHVYVPSDRDWNGPVDITQMNPTIAGADGEIVSTTADLNRFHRALVQGRLLRPAELTEPNGAGIGMGLEILEMPCGRAVGHGGGGPGFFGMSFSMKDGS